MVYGVVPSVAEVVNVTDWVRSADVTEPTGVEATGFELMVTFVLPETFEPYASVTVTVTV